MLRSSRTKFMRRTVRHNPQERRAPILKSAREIQIMREAGRIVARVHAALREAVQPGVSTLELDQLALEVLQKYGAVSSFYGYRGYPAQICTSINQQLVHGIPNKDAKLAAGDIISIDVGAKYRGFIGDSAWSYAVGEIDADAQKIMNVTEQCLYAGIEQAVVGNQVQDVSRAIQQYVEERGLFIVREYTGHGIGRQMHEPPQILNYVGGDSDGSLVMEAGLVMAIEPMVQLTTWQTRTLDDNWTVVSRDGGLAAHFEHTVAVTNNGPEILTLP